MVKYKVNLSGEKILDKHTHYEAYPLVDGAVATVIIRGDIATGFQKKYGVPITQTEKFGTTVDLIRNDNRACPDPFKSGSYLIGSIGSLEDIFYYTN